MYIAYLYEGDECIAQIEDILELDADLKINGVSQAKIVLDIQSPYINQELLRMWRRIKIGEVVEGKEFIFLDGIIRGVESGFSELTIICESWYALLEKRLTMQSYTFKNSKVKDIISQIFSSGTYPFSVFCNDESLVSIDCGIRVSIASFLQNLSKEGVDFLFRGGELIIGKNLGRDRTDGPEYKDFRYDIFDPEGNTINKAKLTIDAKEISNRIVYEGGVIEDQSSIGTFGLLEESPSNEDKTSYLSEHKDQTSEFSIQVSDIFFHDVQLCDQVQIFINGGNELMQFDGPMKIIGKKYQSGDMPKIEYTVSTKRIPQEGFIGTIKKALEKINQK